MGQAKRKERERSGEAPLREAEAPAPPEAWQRPRGLTRVGWGVIAAIVLAVNVPVLHYALLRSPPEATVSIVGGYNDDFSDPQTVPKNYAAIGGHWRVVSGELLSPGVKNNPLWLRAKLPRDVVVELDVRSESPEGDVKVEIFGDGVDHASGYVLIHGGWNNSISIIARLDEHGPSLAALEAQARRTAEQLKLPSADLVATGVFRKDTRMRVETRGATVQRGKTYHWRIERRGSLLRWSVDGQLLLELNDPFPLEGEWHDRFGFSSWESQLYFDNLRIQPL